MSTDRDSTKRLKTWLHRSLTVKNLQDAASIIERLGIDTLPDVHVGEHPDGGYDPDVHLDWVSDQVLLIINNGEVIWAKDGKRSGRTTVREAPAVLSLLLSKGFLDTEVAG